MVENKSGRVKDGLDHLAFDANDKNEAERFLARLAGADSAVSKFWFQTFDDSPKRDAVLAKKLHGTLSEHWLELQRMQRLGAGVFVTINESKGGRLKEQVSRVRAVWRDVDLSGLQGIDPAALPLEEHVRVRTVDGYHSYLLTDAGRERFAEWGAVMETMVAVYGADNNAKDLPRVLRVPGFWHLKGKPVKIVIDRISDRAPYTWDEITAAIKPAPVVTAPASRKAVASGHRDDAEAVRAMVSGEDFHGAGIELSSRYCRAGMQEPQALSVLQGMMRAADDGSDRFKARFAELPRLVSSAFAKFAPTSQHGSIVAAIDSAVAAGIAPVSIVDDILGQVAQNKSLTATHVEDLLQRLKKASGIGVRALREDLHSRNDGATGTGETHADFAMKLLENLTDATGEHRAVGVEGQLYRLGDDRVWRGREATQYEVEIGQTFAGAKNCQRRSDFTAIASHAYAIAARDCADFFEDAPFGVACPDGNFYRLDAGGEILLDQIEANHRQRFLAAASPEPTEAMPLFERLLAQTFECSDPAETRAQIELMQEIMGAVLMGTLARHEKAVLFYGPGRAGKGTFLKIIEALVPEHWRAALSPFRWNAEYYLATLAGKRLNLVGELPDDQPIPAADFKTVTGRDLLAGRQPSGRVFSFRNEAAHVFNSNYFPTTRDHSEAFFSRWITVGFANSRLSMGDGAIDQDLAAKIVAQEMPSVMFWALMGASRLQRRGAFQMTATHAKLMGQWRRRTDSVMEFLHDADAVELSPGGRAKRDEVYDTYVCWALGAQRKPVGKQRFNDALEAPAAAAMGIEVVRTAKERGVLTGLSLSNRAAARINAQF
ncbi:MAG: DUF5906 domain-containing protein [Rhizobacter sp.]